MFEEFYSQSERDEFQAWVDGGYTTDKKGPMLGLHRNGYKSLQKHGVKTVFEIGSGLGYFLAASNHVTGYDLNGYSRRFAVNELGVDPRRYTLGTPEEYPHTDAIYCVEVLEHLTDAEIRRALNKCKAPLFYFTSTPHKTENDDAWGHTNIKQEKDWIDLFSLYGYELKCKCAAVTEWGLIFERRSG